MGWMSFLSPHHTTTDYGPFSGPPGELVPEENFWTLWCVERLTEADTPTIPLGATRSGLTSAHLYRPIFFTGRMPFLPPNQQCLSSEGIFPSCHPTKSIKALKEHRPQPRKATHWPHPFFIHHWTEHWSIYGRNIGPFTLALRHQYPSVTAAVCLLFKPNKVGAPAWLVDWVKVLHPS